MNEISVLLEEYYHLMTKFKKAQKPLFKYSRNLCLIMTKTIIIYFFKQTLCFYREFAIISRGIQHAGC